MTDDLWPDEVTLTLGEAAHTLCGTDVSQHSANLTGLSESRKAIGVDLGR